MKTQKISEILHSAADEWLKQCRIWPDSRSTYSCIAIALAITPRDYYPYRKIDTDIEHRIMKGLRNMGLSTDSLDEFTEFAEGEERQAVRYAWLKFAALIAEEQGV
jgi:hypothetical protein